MLEYFSSLQNGNSLSVRIERKAVSLPFPTACVVPDGADPRMYSGHDGVGLFLGFKIFGSTIPDSIAVRSSSHDLSTSFRKM